MKTKNKKVWRYGKKVPFHQNLALICLTGSEKTGFMDGQQMDDGCPCGDSSSAVQLHKAELKIQNFEKLKMWYGDMVNSYLSAIHVFGVDSPDGF